MWGGVAGSKRLVSAPADELRDDRWVAERDLDDVRPPSIEWVLKALHHIGHRRNKPRKLMARTGRRASD